MLLLLRDGRGRIAHIAIGSALLDADWAADVSMLMADDEAPALAELFSYTPREARRAFKELCELGDVDPDPANFQQDWLPAAAGLQTVRWLRHSVTEPRSRLRRLLGPDCLEELNRIHDALVTAESSGLEFHLVEVGERESRRFAGREIVGPENNQMQRTAKAQAMVRRR
jgi:hypothetical protein